MAPAEILEMAEDIADNSEGIALDLLKTQMFSTKRGGLAEGANSPWSKEPLPTKLQYPFNWQLRNLIGILDMHQPGGLSFQSKKTWFLAIHSLSHILNQI